MIPGEATPAPPSGPEFSLRRIGRAAGLLAIAGLAGQAVTVTRELFVANQVGAGPALDALLIALTPPLVLAGVISSGVRAALVPAYVDAEIRSGTDAARAFLGAVLTWVVLIGLVATGVLFILSDAAVSLAGPGLDAAQRAAAGGYARVAAPLLVVVTLLNVLSSVCQIHNRFTPIAVSMGLGPIVSLAVTVILWPSMELRALPIALLAGQLCACAALLVVAGSANMLPRPAIRFAPGAIGDFLRHAGPLAAGSAILQFNLVSDRAVASLVGAGSVSALRYGQQIVIEPLAALTQAWGTVIYPAIVRHALSPTYDLGASLVRVIRASIAVAAPAALWIAAVAPLVVEIVYLRGAFDDSDLAITSAVVVAFAPMIVVAFIQPVLTGAHNARRRATLLGSVAVANATLNLVLNLAFGLPFGVGGVALSTSVTVLILLTFLATRITEPGFDLRAIVRHAARALLAAAIAVAPILVVAQAVPSGLGLGLAPIIAGLALAIVLLYVPIASVLGVSEPLVIVRAAAGWRRRSA